MLRVTPIYGSTGHHPSSKSLSLPPSSTLIEYGDVKLLINVGHDESSVPVSGNSTGNDVGGDSSAPFDFELPQVDAVLLTDSSLQALGGLPIHYGQDSISSRKRQLRLERSNKLNHSKKRSLSNQQQQRESSSGDSIHMNTGTGNVSETPTLTQIYATFPTVKMGQMTLYDHHANICLDGGSPGFTLQDIDSLFTTSKYYNNDTNQNQNNQQDNFNSNNNAETSSNSITMQNNNENESTTTQSATASIQTLKYAQTVIINHPITHKPAISITPHKAGHLIGASYYILKRLIDETEVVVAPIYHHTKEKHLDSSTLYKYGSACDVLITCCGGPGGLLRELYSPLNNKNSTTGFNTIIKRKLNPPSVGRDEGELVETILSTLRRGGNVLLPVDASGRVLELVLLLNQHWEKHRLSSAYNLCWVGNMVHNTIDFVKSQLEWMAKPLGQQFDTGRGHPFTLKNIQMFSNVNELENEFPSLFGMNVDDATDANIGGKNGGVGADGDNNLNSNPTCVLASGASLDYGPARDLFLKWCENGDNAIILTDSRRCVMRGNVVAGRNNKRKEKKTDVDGNMLGNRRTSDNNAAMISDSESIGGSSMSTGGLGGGVSATSSTTSADIPNIVQEDEEVSGTTSINVGTTVSKAELSEFSTAGQLLLKWCEAKAADVEMDDVVECDVLVPKRAALRGSELQSFLEKEEEMRQRERAKEERLAMLREVELAKGRLRLSETDEASSSQKESAGSTSNSKLLSTENNDTSTIKRPKKKSRFDANLFLKFSKPCHSKCQKEDPFIVITTCIKLNNNIFRFSLVTFEVREEAVGIGQPDSIAKYGIGESIGQGGDVIEDDYGISVKHEIFNDIVTGVDPSKYASGGGSGRIGDDVLKRGLGFSFDGRPLLASSGKLTGNEEVSLTFISFPDVKNYSSNVLMQKN